MKKKRFGVEQIVGVLKQAEVGVPVVELIRKVGISEQTFYRWKAKYVGLAGSVSRPCCAPACCPACASGASCFQLFFLR
jgi:hypothetical protein